MKDCIKIEEIKMFVGTGLKFNGLRDVQILSCIEFVQDEPRAWVAGCDYGVIELTDKDFKPLVKPVKELWEHHTKDEIEDKYGVCDYDTSSNNSLIFSCTEFYEIHDSLTKLANEHYDIFDWIGRGLAEEIK